MLFGEVDPEVTNPDKLGLVEVSLEEILEKQAVQQQEEEEARYTTSSLRLQIQEGIYDSREKVFFLQL